MKNRRSNNQRRIVLTLAVLPMMLGSNVNATVSFDMLTVGNPGNVADTLVNSDGTSGHGSVNYTYAIASKSVTNAQYTEFLNKVDPSGTNTLQLWESRMSSWPYTPPTGGASYQGGIDLNTSAPAGSKYSVQAGKANYPAMFVTWASSARFVNWLANGQGTGGTETGVYSAPPLYNPPSSPAWAPVSQPTRASGAQYFLPTEDEYYKAAYFDPTLNGGAGGYYQWGTRSNTAPTAGAPGSGTNVANKANPNGTYWQTGQVWDPTYGNYMVDVGSYPNAKSYYGMLDAEGEVYNWTETFKPVFGKLFPIYKGGAYYYDEFHSGASQRLIYSYGNVASYSWFGFRVAGLPQSVDGTWNVNADGNWTLAGNWSGTSPNAVGATATFGSAIALPRTITVDANRTVGSLIFNSSIKYTLAGSSTLTIDSSSTGSVTVSAGSHDITAPLALNKSTTFTVTNSGSTLKVTNLQTTANSITKGGAGTLEVNKLNANGLTVNAGTVAISTTSTPAASVNVLNSLAITGTGQLDINNNGLVVHSSDTSDTARNVLVAKMQTGMNGFDANGLFAWNGPGIVSSTANAQNTAAGFGLEIYGVAVVSNHDYVNAGAGAPAFGPGTPFLGSTSIGADDILVRYTYTGDVDLNGTVNTDDYNLMDWAYLGFGPTVGFASGDVNLDGTVNSDDYNLADNGYLFGGGQLTQAMVSKRLDMFGPAYVANLESVAASIANTVPEPTTLGLGTLGAIGLLARRRSKLVSHR